MKQIYVNDEMHQTLSDISNVIGKPMQTISENFIAQGIETLDQNVKNALEIMKKARQ